MEIAAWLILRIVYAWLYLYPIKSLISNWNDTLNMVRLVAPWQTNVFAVLTIIVMAVGGLSILFGIYARVGGFLLLFYNLIGFFVHFRTAKLIQQLGSETISPQDEERISKLVELGTIGHMTSASKNIVLAAVAYFFILMGSGPWSLIN